MNPLDEMQKVSIKRRTDFIELELKDPKEYERLDYDNYSQKRKGRRDAERICENIADPVIDIGLLVLAGGDTELPEPYRDIFKKLAQIQIPDKDLAKRLSDLARLGNILAHHQDQITNNKRLLLRGKNYVKLF